MSKETLIEELKVKWGCSRDAAEELFDAGSASRDAEVESLRQQLADVKIVSDHNLSVYHAAAEELRQQLAYSQKQVTLLRDALRHLWNERTPDSYDEAGEALAATADLSGVRLCHAAPEIKETLIEKLRGYKSTPRHCEELCYEAANEIESLRQQVYDLNRLCEFDNKTNEQLLQIAADHLSGFVLCENPPVWTHSCNVL